MIKTNQTFLICSIKEVKAECQQLAVKSSPDSGCVECCKTSSSGGELIVNGPTDLLEEADDVLADLGQAHDDIVGVDVAEGGMVSALSPRLAQHQVPAVYGGKQMLVLPAKKKARETQDCQENKT